MLVKIVFPCFEDQSIGIEKTATISRELQAPDRRLRMDETQEMTLFQQYKWRYCLDPGIDNIGSAI